MKVDDIPWDDPAALALLSRGETLGIFQVESPGMIGLLRAIRPSSLDDVSAAIALYRPGSLDNGFHTEFARRKHSGRHEAQIHPEIDGVLTELLSTTYGVIVYQEQVMKIAQVLAGYSLGRADSLRRAMGKKKAEVLEAEFVPFRDGMRANGYSDAAVQAIWDVLLPFAEYAFNASHSIAYAYLTYRGAYLKANHPVEYQTALLSASDKPDELAKYVAETRRMKIPILGPDINSSGPGFTKTKEGIRYGLRAIRGVGDSAAEAVLAGRPYSTIDQFFRRAPAAVLNSGVFSALVKSGALDSLWSSRTELLEQGAEIGAVALTHRKQARRGQHPAFQVRYRPTKTQAGQAKEDPGLRRALEQEVLGTVLTWPKVVLRLERPLNAVEWKHIKDVLGYENPVQEVYAELGKTRFKLPVLSEGTERMGRAMGIVGVGVESE